MTIDICVRLGRRILTLRTAKGMSQETLAGHSKLNRSTLSAIENGKSEPCLRTLADISKALGITLSELLISID